MTHAAHAYLGLGANLGDATATLHAAIEALAQLPGSSLAARSAFYATAPIDATGPDFINAVARIETSLSAPQLLQALQSLEQAAGRERPYPNAPRTLDLDLLLYGQARIDSPRLTVPHPRMWDRAFVLRPLADVAPEWVSAERLRAVQDQIIDVMEA